MFLSSGATYRPGEGMERAVRLRDGGLSPDVLATYVEQGEDSIRRYGAVPGATRDLFVADLIDRGIISYREVAMTLLDPRYVAPNSPSWGERGPQTQAEYDDEGATEVTTKTTSEPKAARVPLTAEERIARRKAQSAAYRAKYTDEVKAIRRAQQAGYREARRLAKLAAGGGVRPGGPGSPVDKAAVAADKAARKHARELARRAKQPVVPPEATLAANDPTFAATDAGQAALAQAAVAEQAARRAAWAESKRRQRAAAKAKQAEAMAERRARADEAVANGYIAGANR